MEKALMLEAINNGEVIEFLEGKGNYKVAMNQWANVSAPTDWVRIITKGIYVVFNENPSLKVDKLFEDALLKMLDGEVFDIYVALAVFHFHLIREQRGASPFAMDREKILPKLSKTLIDNEEKLRDYFEWEGKAYKEGMWGEVIRVNTLCRNKWNLPIL